MDIPSHESQVQSQSEKSLTFLKNKTNFSPVNKKKDIPSHENKCHHNGKVTYFFEEQYEPLPRYFCQAVNPHFHTLKWHCVEWLPMQQNDTFIPLVMQPNDVCGSTMFPVHVTNHPGKFPLARPTESSVRTIIG